MKKSSLVLIVVLVVVALIGFAGCGKYNTLQKLDENVNGAWGAVQTQYQRRADLIDNLVATVKGAANFEKSTLTEVINARAKATSVTIQNTGDLNQSKIDEFQAAQGQLNSSLSRLLVTVEQYPDLKATAQFGELRAQIEGTENRIANARNDFNNTVRDFNATIRTFPNNIVAGFAGLQQRGYFKADAGAEKAPKVEF
ncbi:LemA family protein [Chitinophaga horti]|uniref:LemA family protein n=1 Tax=Chitinophaga horti TaxID=2920382 RepID=A0ABY6J5B2_9BACT|nr:LemA family protein [Chitinophaga horti]UYQ93422.1 LemA family protein [Chitinophaga horti]